MAHRTKEQILDQAVYALQCVSCHYGSAFNEDGLQELRSLLAKMPWYVDSGYICDVYEDDPNADFASRIIWPNDWIKLDFNGVASASRGEQ